MILDKALTFSDRQALAANTYSTDSLDIGGVQVDGLVLHLALQSESGTSPTLDVELETSSDGNTYSMVFGLKKPAGAMEFGSGLHGVRLKRYVRLRYVLGGSIPAFVVTAALVTGSQLNRAYPDSPRQA
jgi:hypothetical protein